MRKKTMRLQRGWKKGEGEDEEGGDEGGEGEDEDIDDEGIHDFALLLRETTLSTLEADLLLFINE